jgi:hypothetical protein
MAATLKFDEFPYEVDLGLAEEAVLFEAWLEEKSTLKKKEMAKLFQWDAQESKGSDTPQGFSKYLFDLYMSDVANGWSISEEVDPFKLLPLQAQEWYWGLYSYNRTLLHDCHRDDERYPELEFADFLNEIYNDNDQREDWETATPESQDPATDCAVSLMLFILEYDSDVFDTEEEYRAHCNEWKHASLEELKTGLIQSMKENDTYNEDYWDEDEVDEQYTEEEFYAGIDFEFIYNFLKNDYNKWP